MLPQQMTDWVYGTEVLGPICCCSSVVHLTGLIFLQVETLKVPEVVDQLLEDYAQRYHAVKAPRKLQWRKHLGTVKVFLSISFTLVKLIC